MTAGRALGLLVTAVGCFGASAAEPDGAKLFRDHCAACHGETGEGDGPVARALAIEMPNLRTLALRNDGEFPADTLAAYVDGRAPRAVHGGGRMPIWGDIFAVSERGDEDVVAARIEVLLWFIETLQYR